MPTALPSYGKSFFSHEYQQYTNIYCLHVMTDKIYYVKFENLESSFLNILWLSFVFLSYL